MNPKPFSRDARTLRLSWVALALVSLFTIAFTIVGSAGAMSKVDPANAAPPAISGTATEGHVLTASPGTWHGTTPFTYNYQWQRCDATGAGCANIAGAKASTYTLQSTDVGATLRVDVTAVNGHGATGLTSTVTAVVESDPSLPLPSAAPTVLPAGCPTNGGTVPADGISWPARLSVDQFLASPRMIAHDTRSVTAYFHVSACGGSVEGATVSVAAIPTGRFVIPPAQITNADGWVTLKLKTLHGFQATKKQPLLLMIVSAAKPGKSVMRITSSQRLVGVHIATG